MNAMRIMAALGKQYLTSYQSGSRVICDPPVIDTDDDHLVLVCDLDSANQLFSDLGWSNCMQNWAGREDTDSGIALDEDQYAAEDKYGARFSAWRQGEINVIVTDDTTLYLRSVGATLVAKELNLCAKPERIALFRAIKYGEHYEGDLP